jgi:hypothetical protein
MCTLRICSFCKNELPLNLENFAKKNNGFQWHCRKCQKEYRKKHYEENKQKYIDKAKRITHKNKEWFAELKSNKKCLVCSESHPSCLEFHHKNPLEKEGNLAEMIGHSSRNKVLEEIEKCILVCANCHRKIHDGIIDINAL